MMIAKKIAWIGAGKMGLPICKRLKAAGHDVRVLARRPEQASVLNGLGFITEQTIANLVKNVDIVFTAVTDDNALANVLLGDDFAPSLMQSAVVIDMSTVSPAISQKIAAHLPDANSYLRAPVSGSTTMAEAGTLTTMVSGPKPAFEAMTDIFPAFTKKAFYLGPAEEARYLKLAINSMVAATAALLGEALAFGEKGGLTNANMLEVITQSAVASPLIGYKSEMIINDDYRPAATLNMLMKDVDLLIGAAKGQGMDMPVNESIMKIYEGASARGLGEKDFFVLVQEAQRTVKNTGN